MEPATGPSRTGRAESLSEILSSAGKSVARRCSQTSGSPARAAEPPGTHGLPASVQRRGVEIAERTDLPDLAGRCRPLPAAERPGMRGTLAEEVKQNTAAERANCWPLQAESRSGSDQQSHRTGPRRGNRGTQVPKPSARHALPVQGCAERQSVLHLGERSAGTGAIAAGLGARRADAAALAGQSTL